MRRAISLFVVFMLTITLAEGQLWKTQRLELTAGLGTTQLFGDIGGYTLTENVLGLKDLSLRQTRFNISAGANYRVLQEVNARINLAYGMFNSNDVVGSNEARGFKSTTNFFETALIGEFYFIKNHAENSFLFSRKNALRNRPRLLGGYGTSGDFISNLDVYIFTGIGGLAYSVNANEALASRDLQDSGFTLVIPSGLGVKYIYNHDFNFGIELGGRYAFSDYLEGYTSQYSKHNDVYYFFNVTMAYKLPTTPRFIKRR